MCTGSTAAAPASPVTFRGQRVSAPQIQPSKQYTTSRVFGGGPIFPATDDAVANASFSFGQVDDLGLRITSERGRENLAKLNEIKPVLTQQGNYGMFNNAARAEQAKKQYEVDLAAWQRAVTYQEKQLAAIKEEEYRRDAPRRLAEERRALIAQQQAEMVKYEKQMADQQAAQATQVAELQAQQQERLTGIRNRGQAVTQSLQILGQKRSQGPTAATSTSKPQAGGARSTTASLRMGATSRGAGSGANVAV